MVHEDEPVEETEPPEQAVQVDKRVVAAIFPASHEVQVVELVTEANLPAAHEVQTPKVRVGSEYVPISQAVQEAAAVVEVMPAAQ